MMAARDDKSPFVGIGKRVDPRSWTSEEEAASEDGEAEPERAFGSASKSGRQHREEQQGNRERVERAVPESRSRSQSREGQRADGNHEDDRQDRHLKSFHRPLPTRDETPGLRLILWPVGLQVAPVHELEAEPALDAEVAVGDFDIDGRGHLDDPIVLNME